MDAERWESLSNVLPSIRGANLRPNGETENKAPNRQPLCFWQTAKAFRVNGLQKTVPMLHDYAS